MYACDLGPGHERYAGGGEPTAHQRVQPQLCPARTIHVCIHYVPSYHVSSALQDYICITPSPPSPQS